MAKFIIIETAIRMCLDVLKTFRKSEQIRLFAGNIGKAVVLYVYKFIIALKSIIAGCAFVSADNLK